MQQWRWYSSLLSLLVFTVSTGCTAPFGKPNWKALYEQKLNQPLTKLHEASLNQPFTDTNGNLTRVSWADLADGTTVLLGLPAYQDSPQTVVNETIVLSQARWKNACRAAVGKEITSWTRNHSGGAVSNQLNISVSTQPSKYQKNELFDSPELACQFVFLPSGWRLRLLYDKGKIEP